MKTVLHYFFWALEEHSKLKSLVLSLLSHGDFSLLGLDKNLCQMSQQYDLTLARQQFKRTKYTPELPPLHDEPKLEVDNPRREFINLLQELCPSGKTYPTYTPDLIERSLSIEPPFILDEIDDKVPDFKKLEVTQLNFDPYQDETTDDVETDGDSICSNASDIETVDTQRNASGPSTGDTSLLSDESTFVHLEETGLEENEQDLGTSIQQNQFNKKAQQNQILKSSTDNKNKTHAPKKGCFNKSPNIVNGVLQLSELGRKNKIRLINTGQCPGGPNPKVCPICNSSMDWRTSGTIMGRKNKSGVLTNYTYGTAHNGYCAKEAYSDKNSAKVSRISANNSNEISHKMKGPSMSLLVY
jgi:hypothetical protein